MHIVIIFKDNQKYFKIHMIILIIILIFTINWGKDHLV